MKKKFNWKQNMSEYNNYRDWVFNSRIYQPTCDNPNNERIADYGGDDDGGEGECPEQVNVGPVQHCVRDVIAGGRGEVHHDLSWEGKVNKVVNNYSWKKKQSGTVIWDVDMSLNIFF